MIFAYKLLWICVVLYLAIAFHEFGHWLYMYRQGHKQKIFFFFKNWLDFGFRMSVPKTFNQDQKHQTYLFGVAFGLVPIIFAIGMTGLQFFVFALPIYMAGCSNDLKAILEVIKEKGVLGDD